MPLNEYIFFKSSLLLKNLGAILSHSWLATFLLAVIAFFEPIHIMLLLTIFAVFIDTLSGIFCSIKKKVKITSFRLRDTVIKLFLYLTLIMLVFGIQTICLWGLPISNLVASFILFAESLSIGENIDIISNEKLGLAKFLKKIRSKWLGKVDDDITKN